MIYFLITDSCIYKEPEDLLSWVPHRPASSERLIGQWPPQPTRGPDGHPLMLTQSVCVSVYPCVWVCTTREFFGQAERLHPIGLREDVVRTHQVSTCMRSIRGGLRWLWQPFHVRVGDILTKKRSTLSCVRQNCTLLLKNYSIPWDIINSLDVASSLCVAPIIINYHQISKFKSSLMLDVIRCASRLLLA